MTNTIANFIQIEGDKITGNIATLSFDIDVIGETVASTNGKAPIYRLLAKTPRAGAGSMPAASGSGSTAKVGLI